LEFSNPPDGSGDERTGLPAMSPALLHLAGTRLRIDVHLNPSSSMWPLDELNDESTDVRLTFGRRYGWHLREAADVLFRTDGDHGRLAALWVQQMLHRGELFQDCDSDRVLLRLTIGPWTFDFDIYWDQAGGAYPVRAALPDTLFRDCFAITASDYRAEELAHLRAVVTASGSDVVDSLIPQLVRLHSPD